MIVQTKDLDVCAGRYVSIPDDSWPEVIHRIDNIKVISRELQFLVHLDWLTSHQDQLKPRRRLLVTR